MILDGINMEVGARRGHEKITRVIRKRLLYIHAFLFLVNALMFSLAAIFLFKNIPVRYTFFVIAIPQILFLPQILFFAYVVWFRGNKIIRILNEAVKVRNQANAVGNVLQRRDWDGLKMIKISNALVNLIPKLFYLSLASFIECLGEVTWTILAVILKDDSVMNWSSFVVGARILGTGISFGVLIWLSAFEHEDKEVRVQPRVFTESMFQVRGRLGLRMGYSMMNVGLFEYSCIWLLFLLHFICEVKWKR